MENNDEIKKEGGVPIQNSGAIPPQKHVVRSLETDMAGEIREHQGAVVQIAIAENEKKEKLKEITSIKSKSNIFFLTTGVLFFAVTLVLIFLFSNKKEPSVEPIKNTSNQIITSDQDIVLDISGLSKTKITNKIVATSKEPSDVVIKNIILTENEFAGLQKISLRRFFTLMEFEGNENILSSLSDNFVTGTYTCQKEGCLTDQQFFIIAQVVNQNMAFRGMQEWENKMQKDLSQIFKIKILGNSLDSVSNLSFQNEIIANETARVLKNTNNNWAGLIYIFPNKNTLIISDGEEAIVEIISRLSIQ